MFQMKTNAAVALIAATSYGLKHVSRAKSAVYSLLLLQVCVSPSQPRHSFYQAYPVSLLLSPFVHGRDTKPPKKQEPIALCVVRT